MKWLSSMAGKQIVDLVELGRQHTDVAGYRRFDEPCLGGRGDSMQPNEAKLVLLVLPRAEYVDGVAFFSAEVAGGTLSRVVRMSVRRMAAECTRGQLARTLGWQL